MLMADKITTHQRFLKKAEKDLVRMFKDGEFEAFRENYHHFIKMGPPDIRVEEMFYEAMDALGEYEHVVDYSLMQLNAGSGDYETHMIELLKALTHLERYYEVINFSDHLMEEKIPQGFRIEIAAIRHRAKKAIDDLQYRRSDDADERNPGQEDIDLDEMSHQEILRMFSTFADEKDIRYKDFVLEHLESVHDKDIVTFMLLYLKEIGYDRPVTHHKFGKPVDVVPVDLPSLEDVMLIRDVEPEVIGVLESQSPQIVGEAALLMTSHAIFNYPKEPDFKAEELVEGYLQYILDLLNVDHPYESNTHVFKWIDEMEHLVTTSET